MEKMKFHTTIIDNETGETVHNDDVCAIIGAFQLEDGPTCSLSLFAGSTIDVGCCARGAEEALQNTYDRFPAVELLTKLAGALGHDEVTEEKEEDK